MKAKLKVALGNEVLVDIPSSCFVGSFLFSPNKPFWSSLFIEHLLRDLSRSFANENILHIGKKLTSYVNRIIFTLHKICLDIWWCSFSSHEDSFLPR